MKLLTITVPMYNVSNYIEECLKSFLVPGAEEALEVLVVNDETPDNSREIAEIFVDLQRRRIGEIRTRQDDRPLRRRGFGCELRVRGRLCRRQTDC